MPSIHSLLESAWAVRLEPDWCLLAVAKSAFAAGVFVLVKGVFVALALGFPKPQYPWSSEACRASLAYHLGFPSNVSATRLYDERSNRDIWVLSNLPQTGDRILGHHIPSSSGTSVTCSGDRLLLIPRGFALGALDDDEFGRAETTCQSARVSRNTGLQTLRVWRAQTKPCSCSAPRIRQWFANRPATCFPCKGISKGSLEYLVRSMLLDRWCLSHLSCSLPYHS